MRFTLVWARATMLPPVMVRTARIAMTASQSARMRAKAVREDADQQGEGAQLGAHRQEPGDGGGRALVGIRGPVVKRDGGGLEGASHREHADGHDAPRAPASISPAPISLMRVVPVSP